MLCNIAVQDLPSLAFITLHLVTRLSCEKSNGVRFQDSPEIANFRVACLCPLTMFRLIVSLMDKRTGHLSAFSAA